ncbi:MAG: glycosyltransferase family 4 protein [Gammaproteobacteria bacterium]|nr:glycosyltransferase family 4 protein [Gammaproteobacteria bacterium]
MRILMMTSEFPPRVGGIATHVAELARGLAALGHQVTVIAPAAAGAGAFDAACDKYTVIRHQSFLRAKPLYNLLLRRLLTRLRTAKEFDVVHVHGLRPLRVALELRLPVVFTNHTSGFLMTAAAGGRRLRRTMALLNRVDFLLAPSEELLGAAQRSGLTRPGAYIPNGVDVQRFAPAEAGGLRREWGVAADEIAVLAARRLVEKNGVRVMAEAAVQLRDSACRFIFAGDGPERARVESVLARASMGGRAVFLGAVPHEAMPGVYRAADLCVLPSLVEATSLAGLEAMASGRALVGTRVGGIPSIIEDGATGLLVAPGDPAALAGAIRRLVLDPGLRERMGAAGRWRAVQEFAWETIAARTAAILEQTARRHAA